MEPDSAVPVKVRPEVWLVMLSDDELPVSSALSRSGVDGAEGAALSIVTERLDEAFERLPAVSLDLALIWWLPSASDKSIDQFPPVAVAELPVAVDPS